ncbi:uncharacterized protein [Phyllobates terribilis]|uniref:uncharacterized protein isoform X3 n=1 Tax=Phyllobates terribilis TaxID=111132 RepID=UPI003CCAFC56
MNQSAFGSREIQTYTVAGSWDGRERETVPGGDMSVEDAVKVCLRVRPLNLREQGEQVNLVWKAENNTITQVDGSRSFNFDRVFHSHETTAQVYQEVAVPIIRSALHGYNGTIFAYGQTSSGKTYTMMGAPKNLGIIPQAVGEVFKIIQEIPAREFLLRVSYMEIYNESVTDLLCDDRKKKPLEVREDFNRTVYVADLTEEVVTIPEQVMQWIKKGEKNRHYGETKMNDHSSRSHTIFRMIVESRERNDPGSSENCEGAIMVSHLNLVDLAGSERASQTGAEGVRLKEGCNINRSLFILGQVIKKLSDGQVGGFINYRDSKLTRILQNSLGGNTKTVIICTITPISLDETLSTLQFASTAKHVKNTPHVNEVLDDHALLKRYRKEILDLKKQLEELEASTDIKTHAMEEYNQLLSEIKELQKEKEDRICNLGNMMVASTKHEDQRCKKRRRVTWAPGKLQGSLHSAGISHFDIGSKLTANIAKRQKVSEFAAIPEIDDSICTEFSELDDTGRVLDDLAIDADWNSGSHVTYRERTALSCSMIDFSSESTSAPIKDISLQKYKEMEQKVAELENQLKKLTKDSEEGVGKRESLEKEASDVKEVESNTDKDVQTLQLEDTCVRDQTGTPPEDSRQSPVPGDHPEVPQKLTPLKTDDEPELESLPGSPLSAPIDAVCQDPDEEVLSSNVHDMCWEQIRMLEQKIADLEGSACPENNSQNDLVESLQICEALMAEKQSAHNQLGNMQNDFDNLIAENESLKRELADLEKCLQEKHETNEFEMLEKEAQKEHEAQLTYENSNFKKLIDNSEVYNKELENEVESKSKLLLEQEKQITELKRESEILQKKVRYSDLMASMGNGEKLYEEVFQMQQSLSDAETVTRDAQREAAFLRSENLELKEKLDELLVRCEKREKDSSDDKKQLEFEKSKYKMMQSDLQKELQYAYNEINQLHGLMAGKVPKELMSRIELEKKVEDYSKQLASIMEEKSDLEQKVANLSESLHLCSEVENLRDQAQRTSEELILLKSGKEQSASIINDQEHKLEEQSEQLEKLTGEVTQLQVKYQQAEQQYSELKVQHESLQERCSLTAGDQNKNDSEAQSLLMEVECAERQLSAVLEKKHDLLQVIQIMENRLKELDELFKSSCMENDKLQGQVKHLFSEVAILQQQSEKQSELYKEKQDLEEKYNALLSVKEQLQEQLHLSSLTVLQPENAEPSSKLQELQEELNLVAHRRDELLVKVEDLEAEKNNLKQDLNDNIELSIETEDELRTAQEELEQQKQLVADLRKQLADCGDSSQAEGQKDILEGKLSAMSEKLQENEAKCESRLIEKLELERRHQNLISEMTLLQERMRSAELALSKVEEENAELKQNIKEPPKSWELDEMVNSENRESDPNRQVKQEEDVKDLQLQEQILAVLQEKDALHETMKNLTAERDQLRLDLQENIEMSIDIQDELRSALDELKAKTQLLESLRAQMNELKAGGNGESNRSALQCEVEEKSKKIEELETKVEDVLQKLEETESKYVKMVETLELTTKEKDLLISSLSVNNNNLVNDLAMCKQDKSTQDCTLQVSIETPTSDQVDTSNRQEIETERNELKETLGQLQQQLELICQEKGELQQAVDAFKAERCELMTNLQRCTENEALRSEGECELKNEIEELKEQLKAVQEQQLPAAESEEAVDYTDMEINMPEENVMKNPTLLEDIQEEKLELLSKLSLLQEELQKKTAHRDELQGKLEGMIDENARLQENLESVLSCSSRTKEELQRCQEELNQQVNVVTNLRMEASCSIPKVEKETITDLTPCLEEMVLDLQENLLLKNPEYQQLIKDKDTLELERNHLSSQIEGLMEALEETQSKVVSLQNENLEAERQRLDLQQQIEGIVQERNHLKSIQQRCVSEMEQETQTENKDQNTEDDNLQDMEAQFASLSNEKSNIEEKLLNVEQHMAIMTNESRQLRATIQSLQSERDQLKEDLGENVQLSIETQDDLRKAQHDLKEQMQMVEELTCKIESLEQKSSSVENQLQETILLLKEAISEREIIVLSKEKLQLELKDLHNEIETNKLALDKSEKEGSEAGQKIHDLTAQLKAASEKWNQMRLTNEELQKLSTEIQDELQKAQDELQEAEDELQKAQDELQQQRQRVEKLKNEIPLLEEKSSLLEGELQEKIQILDKAAEDRCVFDLAKQNLTTELEQVVEALKSKEFVLKEAEKEKAASSQKILDLTAEMESITHERDELQNSRQKLEEEAEKLRAEMQQLRHERNLLTDEQVRKTNQLNELETELQQLQEKMHLSEASTKQMKADNVAVLEQLQRCELDVASLRQEQEQFQQLLQRVRSEKENIYGSLQDQEKAVAQVQDELITSQTKLQTVTKERDESHAHLLEKVNEVKERLQEISSLQEQIQQLHEKVEAEQRKNFDLLEEVDVLEKKVRALHQMQNEPVQEEDELAERTEILEGKNQEWKDLMGKIYTVYSDHHSSLSNLSCELQSMTQTQNQSMSAIKESLSSTSSRTFGNLQTEHVKLNSQMQMLLNKFKGLYKNAAVEETHYSSVKDFENELCVLQKKNDQLLLQFQSLEQSGSKWSDTLAEELKDCEIEFITELIYKKDDVIKNVEDGFSEVKVLLNGMENELKQELKCKEEFIEWLSEFQGLHFDTKKLNDGVLQENRRITGVIQNLTKKLKIIAQSKTKQDTMQYLNTLKTDLHEKKAKNLDLMQRMQKIAPSGDCSMLEEENARLRETLKNVQGELKGRIQDLEKQLSAVEADAKQKEQRALLLEDKLRSNVAESELYELQVIVKEKEQLLQAAQKEIQMLQGKISKGAAPYKDEIESLKSRVVLLEMDRLKVLKSAEQQISSLKVSVDDKETRLRKLKEELRRTQKDTDASICSTSSVYPQYPLTCGGGSGIVQSTAMLMLQSQNAALKREIGQYKKKVHQLSRNIPSCEDEVKKLKEPSPKTPTTLLSSLHSHEVVGHEDTDRYRATLVSPPRKSEIPTSHIASLAKTTIHEDNPRLLSKIDVHKPKPMSPNKMERHSAPAMSPDKTRLYGKRPFSPLKTDGPLLSTLIESPHKKPNLPEKVDSPKEKFFDARSKSLPYSPGKFFDNSTLGTLPDIDFSAGTTADSAINDWWDRTGKSDKPNDCKTS